uniref:Neurotransmitter-gated ion-channel ligand-binding domain-containing protein n=1 Tax=Timema poppense TaxID=170557 RepID=A0A7R9D2Z5_TIMPO|nr:unnamed protein product [Timema poppensis]
MSSSAPAHNAIESKNKRGLYLVTFTGQAIVTVKNVYLSLQLSVCLSQSWYDYKLQWDPKEYGGVEMLHVPSDHIWRPDIVLYNKTENRASLELFTSCLVSSFTITIPTTHLFDCSAHALKSIMADIQNK